MWAPVALAPARASNLKLLLQIAGFYPILHVERSRLVKRLRRKIYYGFFLIFIYLIYIKYLKIQKIWSLL